MLALIDSDLLAYRCSASAEGEEEVNALFRLDELMERILFDTNAAEYKAFLTDRCNFRKAINPSYKANRTQPKPIHLAACQDHLRTEWNAYSVVGLEADDLLGMGQAEDTVIVSYDKDLRQVPGSHYNFIKLDWTVVDDYQAAFNFYRQFLIGDRSDNIRGVDGIGEKKAEKELYGLEPEEMFDRVRELYNDDRRMLLNGMCLYIMRKAEDFWTPQKIASTGPDLLKLAMEALSGFSVTTVAESTPSSESTKQETSGYLPDGILLGIMPL